MRASASSRAFRSCQATPSLVNHGPPRSARRLRRASHLTIEATLPVASAHVSWSIVARWLDLDVSSQCLRPACRSNARARGTLGAARRDGSGFEDGLEAQSSRRFVVAGVGSVCHHHHILHERRTAARATASLPRVQKGRVYASHRRMLSASIPLIWWPALRSE